MQGEVATGPAAAGSAVGGPAEPHPEQPVGGPAEPHPDQPVGGPAEPRAEQVAGARGLTAAVVVVGVLAGAAVTAAGWGTVLAPPGGGPAWLHATWLLPLLLAITAVGELTFVRVRHGGTVEELTLFEAAVVVDVLLLPGSEAVAVAAGGLALASLARRRPLVKALFNLGTYTTATAALVAVVHLGAGARASMDLRLTVALCLGTVVFAAVNLLCISRVLHAVGGPKPHETVRDGARVSALMALGTVALGAPVVAVTLTAPALLPFTALPALALTHAYRAAAQEQEERERSARLLALSQVLAGPLDATEVLTAFLAGARAAFTADVALVVLEPDHGAPGPVTVVLDGDGPARRTADAVEAALLARAARLPGARLVEDGLPDGLGRGLLAGLEAEGRSIGAVLLGVQPARRGEGRRLPAGDLTLLTPLASALAVALRGARHLARVAEESGKLKTVVDQSSDGILVLDGEGHVQLWNPALTALTGRDEVAVLGRPLSAVVDALDPEGRPVDAYTEGRRRLTPTTPRVTVELTLVRPDGEQRQVRCAHAGVFEGDVLVRDVVIVHDVTRERQVERLKADFIATVSHELRTPVTPIKGYAALLSRRGDDLTPEKRKECLEVIVERAEHLGRLVEDLLLASRLGAGQAPRHDVHPEAADLVPLVVRATGDYPAERLRVVLPSDPVPVTCDPVRVVQVLTNLVSNGLKYSAPDTVVDVELEVEGGTARVRVTDRGRGIPTDQLDKVFEKFHRVEDPMRMTTGGTGLGLFIARQLTLAMGGGLELSSSLGAGSVFVFSLPVGVRELPPGPLPGGPGRPPFPGLPPGAKSGRPPFPVLPPLPREGADRPPTAAVPPPRGAPAPSPGPPSVG